MVLAEEGERATDVCDFEAEGESTSKCIFAGKGPASTSGVAIQFGSTTQHLPVIGRMSILW